MIILAYLGPFALVPFLMEKDDQDIQWHAKHGLVLLGAEIIISVVMILINFLTSCLGCMIAPFYSLAIIILHVVCIVQGIKGERFKIPGLSDFADQF